MDKHYYTVKMRLDAVTDTGEFDGYASVFDEYIESYNEIVDPGAYKQTLNHNGGHVAVLYMHDDALFTGRPPIGLGLRGSEDLHGLAVGAELHIDTHQIARETWGFMRAVHKVGRKIGLSVGFRPVQTELIDGITHVKEAQLFEYSITPPDWQAGPSAGVTNMRADYQRAQAQFIVEILNDLGVKIPNASRIDDYIVGNSTGRGSTDVDPHATALEADDSTQGADKDSEALMHSLKASFSHTAERMREH